MPVDFTVTGKIQRVAVALVNLKAENVLTWSQLPKLKVGLLLVGLENVQVKNQVSPRPVRYY